MDNKAVDKCPFVFDFVPNHYKVEIVLEDPFQLKYCHDKI